MSTCGMAAIELRGLRCCTRNMHIRDDPKECLHVRSFVGAYNFYDRHVHRVTYS